LLGREISNEAQKIHDAIRHSQLLIHAHAHDGHTTVAVGTYLHRNGESVYLHGEDHLRQIADTFDSPAQALLAFEKVHGAQMRPGPAPLTDTERAAAEARTPLALTAAADPARPEPETVPVYLADAGDHDALLDAFIDSHSEWEKWNTWDDRTTIATHESLALRILFDHEAGPRDARWSIAAYETPVSERMWHMTVTPTTPAPLLGALLRALAAGDAWETALGTPVTDKHVTQATHPLTDAGWTPAVDGRWLRWRTQANDVGVQFDAFAAQNPNAPLDTWSMWAGPSADCPTWTIRASAYTPASLLADLSEELAHGTGTRRSAARATAPAQQNTATLPPKPPQQNPAAPRR
jgi:hypothetical protein